MTGNELLQDGPRVTACTVRLTSSQTSCLFDLARSAYMSKEHFMRARAGLVSGICRVCACTEHAPCADGCEWADPSFTLCSRCAEYLGSNQRDQWRVVGLALRGPDG